MKNWILMLGLCVSWPLFAMQKREGCEIEEMPAKKSKIEVQEREQKESFLQSQLPSEIQLLILQGIVETAKNIEDASMAIKKFSETNHYFLNFINDEYNTRFILKVLADKFTNGDLIQAAMQLDTPAARVWLNHILPFPLRNRIITFLKNSVEAGDIEEGLEGVIVFIGFNPEISKELNNEYVMVWLIKTMAQYAHENVVKIAKELYPHGIESKYVQKWLEAREKEFPLQQALYNAIEAQDIPAIKEILTKNINVNNEYYEVSNTHQAGRTPISHAIYLNNPEILQLLIDAGANLNEKDSEEDTVLHELISFLTSDIALDIPQAERDIIMIEMVLKAGANPHITNSEGQTVAEHVKEKIEEMVQREKTKNIIFYLQVLDLLDKYSIKK